MAGLIKAALALDRGVVPPTLHCEAPNPEIPFDELNLRLVRVGRSRSRRRQLRRRQLVRFRRHQRPRRAGRRRRDATTAARRRTLTALPPLVISARTEASLRELAQRWRDTLAEAPPKQAPPAAARRRAPARPASAAPGGARRRPGRHRRRARRFRRRGRNTPAVVTGTAVRDGKLAFVFSGNGAQWAGMGATPTTPARRSATAVAEADAALRAGARLVGRRADRRAAPRPSELAHADIAQPLLFAIQVGIVTVLRELGIEAAGHIGHSVGEIARGLGRRRAVAGRGGAGRRRAQPAAGTHPRRRPHGGAGAGRRGGARAARRDRQPARSRRASTRRQSVTRLRAGARRSTGWGPRRAAAAWRSAPSISISRSIRRRWTRSATICSRDLAGLRSHAPRDRAGLDRHRRAGGCRRARRRVLVAQHPQPGALHRGHGRAGRRRLPHLCRDRPQPGAAGLSARRAARRAKAQGRVLGDAWPPAGRRRTRFRRSPRACHVAGYDITGAARFDGPAEPRGLPLYPWQKERFWFERTVEASDLVKPALRPSAARLSPGRGGAVLAQSSRSRGPAVARRPRGRRGAGIAGAPRCSKWRWPRRGCAARMPPRIEVGRCRAAAAAAVRQGPHPRDPQRRDRARTAIGS